MKIQTRLKNIKRDLLQIKDEIYCNEENEMTEYLIKIVNAVLDIINTNEEILNGRKITF